MSNLFDSEVLNPLKMDYQLIEDDGNIINLDPENTQFFQAFELIKTNFNVLYITGKAGSGKTTLLKYIRKHICKITAVVAYTGVAAINAGGQTIHSFFKINPDDSPFIPGDPRLRFRRDRDDADETTIYSHFEYTIDRRQIMRNLELLIIDEVSIVRADLVDAIDKLLRAFSGRGRHKPFGGVQVVLIGDPFQLPPIEGSEWEFLSQYYESPFFFSSAIYKEITPIYIELETIYRQKEPEFISFLNRIRINQPTEEDIKTLNNKVQPIKNVHFEENYVTLCSTNRQANEINKSRLTTLSGIQKTFLGVKEGDFPNGYIDVNLQLKVGAQIMFLKNGPNYYNGKIGKIVSLNEDTIITSVINNMGEEATFEVEKASWHYVRYYFNNERNRIEQEIIGTLIQYPLKLAWAITVYKSQGLTFQKVIININHFSPSGLVYVALSRCTSMNGLVLKEAIPRNRINADPRVVEFAKNVTPNKMIIDAINNGEADLLYKEARIAIKKNDLERAIICFYLAIKYRNDIETGGFKKYVRLQFRKINHYSELLKNSRLEQSSQNEILKKLKDENEKLNNHYVQSKKENENHLKSNDALRSEIYRLKNLSWFDKLIGKK